MARKNYKETTVHADFVTMHQDDCGMKNGSVAYKNEGVSISFRNHLRDDFRLVIISKTGDVGTRRTLLCGLTEEDLIAIRTDINAALASNRASK